MIQSMIQRYQKTRRPDLLQNIQDTLQEPCTFEELSEIFHFFSKASVYQDTLFYTLFSHIRRFSSHWTLEQIASLCYMDPQTAATVFFSPTPDLRAISFPIASEQQADLCTAYVIPLHGEGEPLLWGPSSKNAASQTRHQDLQRIQHLTKKRFFVAFDRNFTDRSFMLAVAAALLLEKPHQWAGYAFSGEIDPVGNILQVGYMDAKESFCKDQKMTLLSSHIFQHTDDILYWLSDTPIPLPSLQLAKEKSIVEQALVDFEKAIQRTNPRFRIDTLCTLFGFQRSDFFLHHKGELPNEAEYWSHYIQNDVRQHFERLLNPKSQRSFVLHAVASISALALGMGVILGARRPVVIYHFQDKNYYPVIDLSQNNLREIKTILPQKTGHPKSLSIEPQVSGNKHIVSIYLASHDPFGESQAIQKEHGDGWGWTFLRDPQNQGNLPLSVGWISYVREIYSFLNHLKQSDVREIHFILSTPVAIAYALGMACGHFFHAYAYNHDRKSTTHPYPRVLALHEHPSPF